MEEWPLVNGPQARAKRRPLRKAWIQPHVDNIYERGTCKMSQQRELFSSLKLIGVCESVA